MNDEKKLKLAIDLLRKIADNLNSTEINDRTSDRNKLSLYVFQFRVVKDNINNLLAKIDADKK